MSINSKISGLSVVLALGLSALGQTAFAGETVSDGDTVSVTVSYGDIDTASPGGAKAMLRRINAAAETICGPGPDRDLYRAGLYRHCVRSTVDGAVTSFDAPMVTAMNGGKNRPTQVAQAR